MPEIIDLTVPSPRSEPIEISSDGDDSPPNQQNQAQEKKRRKNKKRKKSKGLVSDAVDSSVQPSRDQSRERGNSCDAPKSPAPCRRSATPPPRTSAPTTDEPGLFYFDAVAAPIALEEPLPEPQPVESDGASSRLLLPSHVTVVSSNGDGLVPVEIIAPPTPTLDDDDYIEYLDYDDGKAQGLVRYFAAPGEESGQSKPSIFKCKNCGAEGDHKTYDCPVQICLTCGARDEHSTRNCPISKTCYTCGMKGHINKTCPNRFSRSKHTSDVYDDCDRCGSMAHKMNECPTLWRIYQYANDEERILIKQSREEKRKFAIGEGGEGYIGPEEWCYNCASTGHLGDDCDELPHPPNLPREPSAFSAHNVMSGPFYDPCIEPARIRRGPRELQNEVDLPHLPDDWGVGAPVNVGKQAKNRDREKLEKRFREQEEGEGGEDWFNDARNVKNRSMNQKGPPPSGPRAKSMKFSSLKDGGRQFQPPPPPSSRGGGPPSLLARIGGKREGSDRRHSGRSGDRDRYEPPHGPEDSIRIRGAAHDHRNQDGRYSNPRKNEREREKDRRDRDRERHREAERDHGPRYRGGYNR